MDVEIDQNVKQNEIKRSSGAANEGITQETDIILEDFSEKSHDSIDDLHVSALQSIILGDSVDRDPLEAIPDQRTGNAISGVVYNVARS